VARELEKYKVYLLLLLAVFIAGVIVGKF